jgi:hypothetical protein
MRNIPSLGDMWRSWAVGAVGVGVVATAFFLGGRTAAADVAPAPATALTPEMHAGVAQGVLVECEPGQRAVIRQAAVNSGAAAVACVGAPQFMGARTVPANYLPAVTVAPRAPVVRRTTTARAPAQQGRSAKKSVAIIAGSTAAGAVIGGVAKGKKGALIGGIVGGAAATIWDQVTRRKSD